MAFSLPGHVTLTQSQQFWWIGLLIRLPSEWFLKDNDLTSQQAIRGRHLSLWACYNPENQRFSLTLNHKKTLENTIVFEKFKNLNFKKCTAAYVTINWNFLQMKFCLPFFPFPIIPIALQLESTMVQFKKLLWQSIVLLITDKAGWNLTGEVFFFFHGGPVSPICLWGVKIKEPCQEKLSFGLYHFNKYHTYWLYLSNILSLLTESTHFQSLHNAVNPELTNLFGFTHTHTRTPANIDIL